MNSSQPFFERLTELASVSCGCGMALGLLLLGTCAGALINTATSMKQAPAIILGISSVVGALIVALVFWIAKKNSDLRIARAQLQALAQQPTVPAPPTQAEHTEVDAG